MAGWEKITPCIEGSLQASGKWLFFTDADVKFEKEAFAKALHYFERHELDHLTTAPNLSAKKFLAKIFCRLFSYLVFPIINDPGQQIIRSQK